jgi:hypothetical protein
MSEMKTDPQSRKPIVFDSSTVSLGLALGGIFALGLVTHGFACGPFAIIGLAFGLVGLYQRKKRGRDLLRDVPAIAAVVINSFLIFVSVFSLYGQGRTRDIAQRMVCGTNLSRLGKAMLIYSCGDGPYPTADKWCDILIEDMDVTEKDFRCPANRKERCSYAINPNVSPHSNPRLVLLFETKGGWNKFGGPELLTTENHKGEGCNILFNDLHVEFVKPERLGELKWKGEEENSVE